jgi:hypothetical protein
LCYKYERSINNKKIKMKKFENILELGLCKLAKYLAPQHSAYSAQQKIKCNNQGKSTHAMVNVVMPF